MLPLGMEITIKEYLDSYGKSSFAKWFNKLNACAAAKVTTALYRLEMGNYSNVASVKDGVFEYKIDFGPGYRIYFGQEYKRRKITKTEVIYDAY